MFKMPQKTQKRLSREALTHLRCFAVLCCACYPSLLLSSFPKRRCCFLLPRPRHVSDKENGLLDRAQARMIPLNKGSGPSRGCLCMSVMSVKSASP